MSPLLQQNVLKYRTDEYKSTFFTALASEEYQISRGAHISLFLAVSYSGQWAMHTRTAEHGRQLPATAHRP
jgi:hypothetical protein